MRIGRDDVGTGHVGTGAFARSAERSEASAVTNLARAEFHSSTPSLLLK